MDCTMHEADEFNIFLSEGSSLSVVSEDYPLYCPNEITDQGPSTPGPPQPRETSSGDPDEAWGGPGDRAPPVGHWSSTHADKPPSLPVRELAKSIQEKRTVRDVRNQQPHTPGVWESWGPTQIIRNERLCGCPALSSLLLWRHSLHTIESRFGVGVKEYFIFLRYLVYLNLLHIVFILAFILVPTAAYGRGSINDSSVPDDDSPLHFFLGTGFMERSPVFYGFYTPGSLNYSCLNTPILYHTGILTILTLSLIMLVRRMAVGYKRSRFMGKRHQVNMSFKVFCGWDFTIQDSHAAGLKHGFIRNDLKLYLEEQNFHLREAQRTRTQWAALYTLRVMLNLFVLSLFGGAFYLISLATEKSHLLLLKAQEQHVWLNILLQYLPAITIALLHFLVNLILPHIFHKISSMEDYSLATQVNTTVMRSIFLKLASLAMFLFFLFKRSIPQVKDASRVGQLPQCWENQFGKEMYKLYMFDFIASICTTLLLDLPTKFLKDKCPSCWLARLSREQRFLIPFNVIDLVYNQTVLWVGVFYCPLLPFLGVIKLMVVFYFKKFKVLQCCVPEQRMFRASSSAVLFQFMLLLGLFMAAATLGLDFHTLKSSSCGPSKWGARGLNVTGVCVDSLPDPARITLHYVASEAFAVPLIMAEILILSALVILIRANRSNIEGLKKLLVMCSSDNGFLVNRWLSLEDHAAAKESDSLNHSDPPVAPPDPPLSPNSSTPT